MAIERWGPGETKPAIPTSTWNAFADAAELQENGDPSKQEPMASLPIQVVPQFVVPSLHCVGVGRPSPNPLGGLITATATVNGDSAEGAGSLPVENVEITNVSGDATPSAPTVVGRRNAGDRVDGESVALVYDLLAATWSEVATGQWGNHLRRIRFLGVPAKAEHSNAFAIVQKKTVVGSVTQAIVSGITWAALDVQSEADLFAAPPVNADDVIEDDVVSRMVTGGAGARVLWREPGLGFRYGLVLLGGGTGGGGGGTSLAYVYDDFGEDIADVRCYRRVLNTETSQYEPDTSQLITARPGLSISLALATGSCCDDGAFVEETEDDGMTVNDPLAPSAVEASTIDLAGEGVASDSTLAILMTDSSASEVTDAAVVTQSGLWSKTVTISSLANGPVIVRLIETTAGSLALRPRYRVFTKRASKPANTVFETPTVKLNLIPEDDTGVSSTDNITSILAPRLECTSPVGSTATGPKTTFYRNGVAVFESAADFFPSGVTGPFKATGLPTTDSGWGPTAYTATLSNNSRTPGEYDEGGHSPVLIIDHKPDDGETGEITATAVVNGNFDTTDATFAVDNDSTFVISNPTGGADPSKTASIPQPTPRYGPQDGDAVILLWNGTIWTLKDLDFWSRECFLALIDGVEHITEPSPCPRRRTHAEHRALLNES